MVQQETDSLSLTFAALADPTRRKILATLRYGEVTVKQLAEPFAISLPAITKHLKVLEKAGLISRGREAQWRPSRLEAGPLKEAADWIDEYRQMWEARLDRLDEYLRELQQKESQQKGKQIMNQEKIKTIIYWIVTAVIAANYAFASYAYFNRGPEVVAGITKLGYPMYFITILGVWKLLGAIAITAPRFPLLKEWAYAGMFFNLTSASISNAAAGMEIIHVIMPMIGLVLVALSWALRPASRRLEGIWHL